MANLSQAPVICIFSHIGFQDAADGASHQALSYIAMISSIPNTEVHILSCSHEAEALLGQAIDEFHEAQEKNEVPKSYVFFLGRENFPQNYIDSQFQIRKYPILKENLKDQNVCLLALGSLVPQALKASDSLEQAGIGSIVIHPSCINKPDLETLKTALAKTDGKVLVVEEHQKTAGFASILSLALNEAGIHFQIKSLAVQGEFGQSAYKALELYQKHGLDAQGIHKAAQELL